MASANRIDPESDPDFRDVGPAKASPDAARRRVRSRRRMEVMGIVLAVVWLGVLVDPNIGRLALFLLGGFAAVVGLVIVAMGLGLLGFGIGAAGDRVVGWLRRGARWPEE